MVISSKNKLYLPKELKADILDIKYQRHVQAFISKFNLDTDSQEKNRPGKRGAEVA